MNEPEFLKARARKLLADAGKKMAEDPKILNFKSHERFMQQIEVIGSEAGALSFRASLIVKDHGRLEKLCKDIQEKCKHLRIELDHALIKENTEDAEKLSRIYFPEKS